LRSVTVDGLAEVYPLLQEKGQAVEVELSEPLLVEGDQRHLRQAVVNLLDNAHQHTPPGTRIMIRGWNNDQEVRLSVGDTGPGIPHEEHETIFQRFHRLDVAAGGSGLGLAIARGLIERHGGRLSVESAPGEGATFQIALGSHVPFL
jgi:signal transduction histidine kinase